MRQDVSDRDSFLKAMAPLRDATFGGTDLTHDPEARTLTFTITREDPSSPRGRFLGRRKPSYLKTVIQVRRIVSYKQYLATGPEGVYVLDRAEVGRGGQEIAFYFRPGDRAVMDVEQIDARVEDVGRATTAPRKPVIVNPLAAKEKAGRRR